MILVLRFEESCQGKVMTQSIINPNYYSFFYQVYHRRMSTRRDNRESVKAARCGGITPAVAALYASRRKMMSRRKNIEVLKEYMYMQHEQFFDKGIPRCSLKDEWIQNVPHQSSLVLYTLCYAQILISKVRRVKI